MSESTRFDPATAQLIWPATTRPPTSSPPESLERIIGFVYPESDDWHTALLPHFIQQRAARMGVRVLDCLASSPREQATAISRLLDERVSVFLLLPAAPGDSAMAVASAPAIEAGVTVLSLGSAPDRSTQGALDSALSQAQAAVATLACEQILGRGTVVFLSAAEVPADSPQRRGVESAVLAFPEVELITRTATGRDVAQTLAGECPNLTAVIADSDDLALEVLASFRSSARPDLPTIVGLGGSIDALHSIAHDGLSATATVHLDSVAYTALTAALAALGRAAAPNAMPVFTVVTTRNIEAAKLGLLRDARQLSRSMARRARADRDRLNLVEAVVDTIPLNLFVKSAADLRLVRVNKAREAWFGVHRTDQVGKTAYDFYPPDFAAQFERSDRAVLDSVEVDILPEEHPTMSPNGLRYVQTKKLPILGLDGHPEFLVGISFDVTERKLAELALVERNRALEAAQTKLSQQHKKLVLAEKMASLGRLTAGIAHEMNTPLAAVRAAMSELSALLNEYEEAIGDDLISAEDHRAIVADMKRAILLADTSATRAAAFVRGMKSQTRNLLPHEHYNFNLVATIKESIFLLTHALRDANCTVRLEVSTFSGSDEVPFFGSPVRVAQVMTNLLTNAIDASKDSGGGEISVNLISSGDRISIRVTDHGCGIEPDILPKIFEPMFTTKPFGQGTGLGLSILHDIVTTELTGTIEVFSTPGEGTTFELFLGPEKDMMTNGA